MQQTLILPYLRTSPIHEPRRDVVLAATDSLTLRVTIVESDDPSAQMVVITDGVGGPTAQLTIWAERYNDYIWDYGAPRYNYPRVLWSGPGTPQIGLGSFDFFLPIGTLGAFPRRCGWCVQLGWAANAKADMAFYGTFQVRGAWIPTITPISEGLLTDDGIQVLEDDTDPVFA